MQIIKGYIPTNCSTTSIAVASIGDSPPQNPVQGLLWIDTSEDNFILKVYDGTTWQIVQADLYWIKIDGGNL
jgi:hypothetical protein